MSDIKAKGGQLIAVCPEMPDVIKNIYEKHTFDFQILSDENNELARKLGIVFTLDEKLNTIYKNWGVDLIRTQGNENDELPVPATFVVDQMGKVVLTHIDTDYTVRLEPDEVLKFL